MCMAPSFQSSTVNNFTAALGWRVAHVGRGDPTRRNFAFFERGEINMTKGAFRIGMTALLCALLLCCAVSADTVTTNVAVDENNVIKPSEKALIGMGDTWDTYRMYLGDSVSTETSQRYLDMIHENQIPVNHQRMSGADANSFFWKDTLGSMEERGDGSPYSRNFGLVEWIKSVQAVNPDAAFTFALNLLFDTVENHADLVRFLTLTPDDPNAVGSDGVNWAQRRVELGIPDPVKIRTFELGNEMYNEGYVPISDTHTVTAAEATAGATAYVADCRAAIDAMKAVNPDISFAMCGYSSGNGDIPAATAWNRKILTELSDDCDYIVDHKYFYDYNFRYIQYEIQEKFINMMNEIPEEKRPKLYYSEYGCWVEGVSGENSMDYLPWPTSLKGALTAGKFLNGFLINSPDVAMTALFCTSGSDINTAEQWAAGFSYFRIFDDGNLYATTPAEMLKIMDEAVGEGKEGENVVKTTLSAPVNGAGVREHSYFGGWNNFPGTDADANNATGGFNTPEGLLTASAHTTAEGGLNLILTNSNETIGHNIVPAFQNSYKLKEELVLTSDSLSDNNIPGTPDKVYTKRNLVNADTAFTSHYIPPKSVVVLKLVPLSYIYPEERDMLTHFVNRGEDVSGVPSVGPGRFGLAGEMYGNQNMADLDGAVLLIPKSGVSAEDIIGDLAGNIGNIAFLGQAEVKRNIAYFDVNLGTEPEGWYQAIIGNFEGGKYEVVDFYYRGAEAAQKQIKSITFADNAFISNVDYLVKANITFNEEFTGGEPCKVTVVRGNGETVTDRAIVHTGYLSAIPGGEASYEFYMPLEAISGNYTAVVSCTDSETGAEFYFRKPDETLSLADVPKNHLGSELTFQNIAAATEVNLSVQSNSDAPVSFAAITAFYGKDKRLLCVGLSSENTAAAGKTVSVKIPLSEPPTASAVDYIAIYLMDSTGNIAPYSNRYYVK